MALLPSSLLTWWLAGEGNVYITLISHETKMFVAGIIEISFFVLAVYFLVLVIIGHFKVDGKEMSPELKAIEILSTGLNSKLDSIKGLLASKQADNKE